MVRVQIVSDLHIEYKNDDIPVTDLIIEPNADILILAGDIGSLYKKEQLYIFLENICKKFKLVLYIPGNHEYYMVDGIEKMCFSELNNILYEIEGKIKNLHILNRNSIRIGDVCIAGCTLWSQPLCMIPKFLVRINGINTMKYKNMHSRDVKYISNITKYCKDKGYKLTIITHHPPTYKCLENTKKRKKYTSLYASNLDYFLDGSKVQNWICGHVHKNFDFINEKGCRIVSNQKGKPRDRIRDYSKNFTITL